MGNHVFLSGASLIIAAEIIYNWISGSGQTQYLSE